MLKEGLYEELISKKLEGELAVLENGKYDISKEKIDVEEARKRLSSYISAVTRKALRYIREGFSANESKEALLKQVKTCNEIIEILAQNLEDDEFEKLKLSEEGEVLTSIYSKLNSVRALRKVEDIRPVTPLSESSLFTGSHYEPNMMSELQKEILSSDSIDMLVSFIKWSGLRCIIEQLREFTERQGTELRVITTSYMEATDFKAIMELSKLKNTKIKVSYDVERTRLHAKAYLFKRETGFSTAYIGSSNISNPALTSGLEWNLKVTEKDSFDIIKKFEATYESYWNDKEFVEFNGEDEQDAAQLHKALTSKKDSNESSLNFNLDITPYHYQKEILEKLQVEREIFGRNKNLLVAATGVGKTIISAFDYKRFLKNNNGHGRLLFVAHREEILAQSLTTFRAVLKNFNFGELLVGGRQIEHLDHLFISIQSFNSKKLYEKTSKDFYDFIIVDEFHHAAAPSYITLLDYYKPKVLLGLTATPERMDGKNVLEHFDDRIAAEMRLTEAIDRKLLSPFQYFCVTDTVDLSKLKWSRKGYDTKELEGVYTSNSIRTNQILKSLKDYVTSIDDVRGLGFCTSIDHAIYMAEAFNKANIPSIALYAGVSDEERETVKHRLVNGEINFIFVVDLYNEGVDIPEINTVLFLRPTESLTVFLQQLGRGLRLSEGKECLTVLDFVGQAHASYNFEEKFRALIGKTKHSIAHYVENGFLNVPKGCFIALEKQAKEYILRNIKASTNSKRNIIEKMKYFSEDTRLELNLTNFLNHYNLSLYDLYGKSGDRSFMRMATEAGVGEAFSLNNETKLVKRLPSLFHIDSVKFIGFIIKYLKNELAEELNDGEKLMLSMLYYTFYSSEPKKEGFNSFEDGLSGIKNCECFKNEIIDILTYKLSKVDMMNLENDFNFSCPLDVHCSYNTNQILAAFGYFNEESCPSFREGVKYFEDKKLDIFFITLNKSDKDFSPSTLYEDYAINESLFHWQSQSKTGEKSVTGQRYINHKKTGNSIALFAREYKTSDGYTSPFIFLGTCEYVSHSGEKPMSIVWELKQEMPPRFVPVANKSIL
ncbi:DEAD/DEAH box helicase [Clostridium sp. C8-1-8]|uniref:DEAD/DEAH box helicase n=1 Tax=Clostridium sp. C8-1-8 TaxID=2698831 RepID=UPI00137078BF|nr:DEAD/DEAH box helicase [Clostridium sp. C8-1-8]